jgi:hypothetical protein
MPEQDDIIRDLAHLLAGSVHENAIPAACRLASRLRITPESGAKLIEARLREALAPAAPTDPDASPLTCGWCRNSPATHLLITDVKAAGKQSADRYEEKVCAPCAHQTTVLPPSFVGYWLYELVPDQWDDPPSPEPSLGKLATDCLLDAGHRNGRDPNPCHFPAFMVTEDVGLAVTVGIRWLAAGDPYHAILLAKYAAALRAGGFEVCERDGYLYVPDPRSAGQDTATAAGEGNR